MSVVSTLLWASSIFSTLLWLARGHRGAGVYALMVTTYLIVGAL